MAAKNDPDATYIDLVAFTEQLRDDKIRSQREYEVFLAAGMLDGRFPPDPIAHFVGREVSAQERFIWWRHVLGPRCIEKPPAGVDVEALAKPTKPPRAEPKPDPEPKKEPERVVVEDIAPLPAPISAPEPEKPKQQRRYVRRQAPKQAEPAPAPPPPRKDPDQQRVGPPAEKKPKPPTVTSIHCPSDWNED